MINKNKKSVPIKKMFKNKQLDAEDKIHHLKSIQDFILNSVLKGIKNINKILIRKSVNNLIVKNNEFVKEDCWVLDTIGSNLENFKNENIDADNTITNNIREVYNVLGIEAARKCLYNEIDEAFTGTAKLIRIIFIYYAIEYATKRMVSVFRHGINKDDIGPIAKASFEETPEMFFSGIAWRIRFINCVSSNVMCGQKGFFGTNMFQLVYDYDANMENLEYTHNFDTEKVNKLKELQNEQKIFKTDNICENIEITNGINNSNKNTNIQINDIWSSKITF